MWQMKEWFLKFVVQALWRRRKLVYYAVSVVSIAGNLVLLLGPLCIHILLAHRHLSLSLSLSLILSLSRVYILPSFSHSLQASVLLHSGALQAAWSVLPQVAVVVLHRSVLYILLNLIVASILVKSGMLGQTPAAGMPTKLDDFCLPSSYYVLRGLPWPAYNTYTVYGTQAAPGVHMFTDPPMLLHQTCDDDQIRATSDVCAQTPAPEISKSCGDDEQPKCAPPPSLFTIEPLNELVQTTESNTIFDEQAHIAKTLKHPLRKVASRAADLHRSVEAQAHVGTMKDSMKAEHLQQKNEQSLQQVLGKQDVDVDDKENGAGEDDDNRLSRQEFNERVDSFIVKFKRNLTMQRQDSFNRLLGLVGGGGDIRLIK